MDWMDNDYLGAEYMDDRPSEREVWRRQQVPRARRVAARLVWLPTAVVLGTGVMCGAFLSEVIEGKATRRDVEHLGRSLRALWTTDAVEALAEVL